MAWSFSPLKVMNCMLMALLSHLFIFYFVSLFSLFSHYSGHGWMEEETGGGTAERVVVYRNAFKKDQQQ